MNSFARKLFWIFLLALVVAGISFLCLCFVPLEEDKEANSEVMLWEGGKHDEHVELGKDEPCCRGCHPFLWRFNTRMNKGEEAIDQIQKDAEKEQKRQENIEKNKNK